MKRKSILFFSDVNKLERKIEMEKNGKGKRRIAKERRKKVEGKTKRRKKK